MEQLQVVLKSGAIRETIVRYCIVSSDKNTPKNCQFVIKTSSAMIVTICEIGPDRAQSFLCANTEVKNQLRPFIWLNESAPD